MQKGLFLGLTTIDLLYGVDKHPSSNEKVKAVWQLVFAGGPAANAAVSFAALGNKSHLISGLGIHPATHLAQADLEHHGVHFHDCTADPHENPVLSSILINSTSGDRCVVYSNTDNRRLRSDLQYEELLDDCAIVMFDGYYLPQAIELARYARNNGIITVLDGGSWKPGLEALLPFIDYSICSETFLPPGCTREPDISEYLLDFDMKGCGITHGEKPIYIFEDGKERTIEVASVAVVDTLGAGDILHGVFCSAILSSSFRESIKYASRIASQSCQYFGTRQWIAETRKQQ